MGKSMMKDGMSALNGVIEGGLEKTDARVKTDLKEVANKLSTVLLDDDDVVPHLPLQELGVRTWLAQVHDAVNDLHELVEAGAGVTHSGEPTNRLISWARRRSQHSTTLEKLVKDMADFVQRLLHEKPKLQLLQPQPTQRSMINDMMMVGRDEEMKYIIQQLLIASKTHDILLVIPILGIPGLGKSKLAKSIFFNNNNNNNPPNFEFKKRVDCGDQESFTINSLVNSILQQQPFTTDHDDEQILKSLLLEAIQGRRYLLVLDDVTTVDPLEWHKFTNLLPSNGSILITTSSSVVAEITATVSPVKLQGLTESHSWDLFHKIPSPASFDSSNSDTTNKYIKNMVEKCRGVPLAIQIMRSLLLSDEDSEKENNIIIESIEDRFLQQLERVYCSKLCFPLKLCFAFCSLFPNDDVIDVPRLINLWIGERFILPRFTSPTNLDYKGVSEQYFQELHGMSIFQDLKQDELGNPITCRMHPLMHDLALFVAKQGYISVRPDGKGIKSTVRHASFDFRLDVSSVIPDSLLSHKLLTILLPAAKQSLLPNDMKMSTTTAEKIFDKLRTLRVLDFHDLGMKSVPKSISDLGELRYLDLSRNNMEKLPNSITKLSHLQTLKLSHCRLLKELPKDLDDLTRLRHLEIDGCLDLSHMPECIKDMTYLRTLTLFMAGNHKSNSTAGTKGLAALNKLRGVLEIAHLERCVESDAKEAKLQDKHDLQRLILRWDHDDDGDVIDEDQASKESKFLESLEPPKTLKALILMGFGGTTLSNWRSSISPLQSLVKFSLINCCNCQSLLPLHNLQSLKILELRRLDSLRFIVDNSDESDTTQSSNESDQKAYYFPSLKELTISDCPNLESWWKDKIPEESRTPSFSSISILNIQYCPKLKHMPLCVELDEKLEVVSSSVAPVLETVKKSPFSKLKSMLISNINHEAPPKELLKKFTSLEHLHIRECHRLKSLPEGFRNLASLQHLMIENCKELDLMKDSSIDEWRDLKNLRTLTIRGIPKLECLPKGLECVTTMQELHLHGCPKLMSLSDDIGNLKSLKTLDISDCNNLASLPKGLKSLTSLDTLLIKDCPKLMPRVQPDTGDDWPQIKDIPNRSVWITSQ